MLGPSRHAGVERPRSRPDWIWAFPNGGVFPLDRRSGLYGVFEEPLVPVVKLSPQQVATMNKRVASNAARHVYSAEPRFVLLHEGIPREVAWGNSEFD